MSQSELNWELLLDSNSFLTEGNE